MITPLPIRLFCDQADVFGDNTDLNTSQQPQFVTGDDIEIDIGLGLDGNLLTGLTQSGAGGIASITCQLFASQQSQAGPVMTQTTTSLNTALTQSEWNNDTTPFYHANFVFPNAQTALLAAGAGDTPFWLRIFITTSDATAKQITVFEGAVTVKAGPISVLSAPPANGTKYVVDNGIPGTLAIRAPDGTYRALEIAVVGGVLALGLSDTAY